jgi:hypothetical protein
LTLDAPISSFERGHHESQTMTFPFEKIGLLESMHGSNMSHPIEASAGIPWTMAKERKKERMTKNYYLPSSVWVRAQAYHSLPPQ